MKRALELVAVCVLLLGIGIQSRSQGVVGGIRGPGPEVKKLDYFTGNWKMVGNGALDAPQGNISEDVHYEWMPGGFYVVGHLDSTTMIGNVKGVAIIGYDENRKVYIYHGYTSIGTFGLLKGTLEGDTWTWTGDNPESTSPVKNRVIMKIISDTKYTYKVEISESGRPWRTVGESTATKMTESTPKDN